MADNPASNIAQGAKNGIAAMPKWVWIAVVGAGLLVGMVVLRRSNSPAAAAAAAPATTDPGATGVMTPAPYVPSDGSNNPYGDPYGPAGPSVVSVPAAQGNTASQSTTGDTSPISNSHAVTATAPPPQPVSITLMTGGGPPATPTPSQGHSANYHPNAAKGNKYRWTDGKWHKTPQPGQTYY